MTAKIPIRPEYPKICWIYGTRIHLLPLAVVVCFLSDKLLPFSVFCYLEIFDPTCRFLPSLPSSASNDVDVMMLVKDNARFWGDF